jgi:hypothetical protein
MVNPEHGMLLCQRIAGAKTLAKAYNQDCESCKHLQKQTFTPRV